MDPGVLADAVTAVHLAVVSFALAGALAVLVGGLLGWRWVRRPIWRIAHLGLVLLVAGQAVAGVPCFLTVWEQRLRTEAGQWAEPEISFVGRLLRDLLYVELAPASLLWIYLGFALLVGTGWVWVRPRWRSE